MLSLWVKFVVSCCRCERISSALNAAASSSASYCSSSTSLRCPFSSHPSWCWFSSNAKGFWELFVLNITVVASYFLFFFNQQMSMVNIWVMRLKHLGICSFNSVPNFPIIADCGHLTYCICIINLLNPSGKICSSLILLLISFTIKIYSRSLLSFSKFHICWAFVCILEKKNEKWCHEHHYEPAYQLWNCSLDVNVFAETFIQNCSCSFSCHDWAPCCCRR